MPFTTTIVDAYREVFEELAFIKSEENGQSITWRKS